MTGTGRILAFSALAMTSCVIDAVNALPPLDAAGLPALVDAAPPAECTVAADVDSDGDGIPDCEELEDGLPGTDPQVFNGLRASIGEKPFWSGSCSAHLADRTMMEGRFSGANLKQSAEVVAGWEFSTDVDDYKDASFGFSPAWTMSEGGSFSVRFAGTFVAEAGRHCFRIDIGANGGTSIIDRNSCGQVWLDTGSEPLLESGYDAVSLDARQACVDLTAGAHSIDLVYWFFNTLEKAQLQVRHCQASSTDDCEPGELLTPEELQAAP